MYCHRVIQMTQARSTLFCHEMMRRLFPVLAVFLMLPLAAQAQQSDRAFRLCELPDDLTDRQLAGIRSRADFGRLVEYASEYCPEVALRLTDTATASIPAAAAPAPEPQDGARSYGLCNLPADLSARQIASIRARQDFADLLTYAADNCPEVALLLTETATATITTATTAPGGDGTGDSSGGTTGGTGGDTGGGTGGGTGGSTGGTGGGGTGGGDTGGGNTGGGDTGGGDTGGGDTGGGDTGGGDTGGGDTGGGDTGGGDTGGDTRDNRGLGNGDERDGTKTDPDNPGRGNR